MVHFKQHFRNVWSIAFGIAVLLFDVRILFFLLLGFFPSLCTIAQHRNCFDIALAKCIFTVQTYQLTHLYTYICIYVANSHEHMFNQSLYTLFAPINSSFLLSRLEWKSDFETVMLCILLHILDKKKKHYTGGKKNVPSVEYMFVRLFNSCSLWMSCK